MTLYEVYLNVALHIIGSVSVVVESNCKEPNEVGNTFLKDILFIGLLALLTIINSASVVCISGFSYSEVSSKFAHDRSHSYN